MSAESKEMMNKVIDSVRGANLKFKIVKKYIDEYDFYSMLAHGEPQDEFASYSRALTKKIRNAVAAKANDIQVCDMKGND